MDHIPSGVLNPWVFSENTQYTLYTRNTVCIECNVHAIVIDTYAGTTFAVISERSNHSNFYLQHDLHYHLYIDIVTRLSCVQYIFKHENICFATMRSLDRLDKEVMGTMTSRLSWYSGGCSACMYKVGTLSVYGVLYSTRSFLVTWSTTHSTM